MVGLLDFFSREAGQARRAALDEFGRDIGHYVPPELRGILGFAAEMTPTATLGRAGQASQRMVAPNRSAMERVGDLGSMLSETAAIAAPAAVAGRAAMPAAQAVQEGLLGFSMGAQDVGRAVVDRLNQPGPMPTLYSNPLLGPVDNTASGIRAYHGSPHDFDRFRMSAIGTGEGAQAYGPGLYFAEAEGVAREYRDALSGRNYRMAGASGEVANKFGQDVVDIFEASGGDRGEITSTLARLRNQVTRGLQDAGVNNISKLDDTFNPLFVADIKATNDRAERLAAFLRSDYAQLDQGRMYEVNINANPEDFIDYDAPLSAQSENVQRFANERWQQIMGRSPDPTIEGEYILKMASPQSGIDGPDWLLRGGPSDAQRDRLLEAGIPGVRYLDAGSRGAGDGSRNYVVFDENLINIVRRYGIAGAAALLGLSVADVESAMAGTAESGLLAQ